jgi:hypothetical protein
MRLRIVSTAYRGVPNQERLHLSVLVPANLVNYAVFNTVKLPGNLIVSKPKNTYWFIAQAVKPGDNVVLYTTTGTPTKNLRPDGGTDYFYYWGLHNVLWSDPSSCAVVVEINDWVTSL